MEKDERTSDKICCMLREYSDSSRQINKEELLKDWSWLRETLTSQIRELLYSSASLITMLGFPDEKSWEAHKYIGLDQGILSCKMTREINTYREEYATYDERFKRSYFN